MKFVWDPNKEAINIKKHGIDFSTASYVFNDYQRLEQHDSNHSIDEDRYKTIGMLNLTLIIVCVIYTLRNELCRIISARRATKKEEAAYYGNL